MATRELTQPEKEALRRLLECLQALRKDGDEEFSIARAEMLLAIAAQEPDTPVLDHTEALEQTVSGGWRNATALGTINRHNKPGYGLVQPALSRLHDGKQRLELSDKGNKLMRKLLRALEA